MLLLQHFTKQCTKCQEIKVKSLFMKDNSSKSGLCSSCKQCFKKYREDNKQALSNYRQANKQKICEYNKEYRNANKQRIYDLQCKHRELNRQKASEYNKEYAKTPKGKAAAKNTRYKRRSKLKQGDVTTNQLLLLEQTAKLCYWCKCSLKSVKVNIDHYVPIKLDGEHTLSNLVVSCAKCNQTKNAKDPIKFAQSIGRLF